MIQVKSFTDSVHASAEDKANRFLANLDPDRYVDTKFCVERSDRHLNGTKRAILIIYRAAPGG